MAPTRRRFVFSPAHAQLKEGQHHDESAAATTSYSLLQLSPALIAHLTSSNPTIEIRGHASDAAVLVAGDETYAIRGVQNSNSIMLCSSGEVEAFKLPGDDSNSSVSSQEIVAHATLHETLEVLPAVARTERLESLLAHTDYTGETKEAEGSKGSLSMITFGHLQSHLPAADAPIRQALRAARVIPLSTSNYLRRIPPAFLLELLPPLLKSLPPPSRKGTELKPLVTVPLSELLDTLDAADCGEEAARKILEFFGSRSSGTEDGWTLDIPAIVREIGVCVLAERGYGPQSLDPFHSRWRTLSEPFSSLCTLPLVADTTLPLGMPPTTITYYPLSLLSPDPPQRFAELFAVQARWKEEDMIRFIDDLVAGDKKRRDAMVLKFVRKVKEPAGVIWTARNNW